MFWTELCFILVALMIGARIGGVFLGMVGGLGVGVMVFIFGLTPSTPPIDVILIILSVVLAAASLQASGGKRIYWSNWRKKFCVATLVTLRY